MSKRLQVVMDERELAETQDAARRQGLTVAEWVRGVLRSARRATPSADVDRKLAAIRAGTQFSFPTADIDDMLAQISAGVPTDLPR